MPKMKSHRGAAKRFKLTAKGKVVYKRAGHSHLLEGKSAKRKRPARRPGLLDQTDLGRIGRLLPYG